MEECYIQNYKHVKSKIHNNPIEKETTQNQQIQPQSSLSPKHFGDGS